MKPLPYYLDPELARQNLIASRLMRLERIVRRRRVATTERAFQRLGYDATAARELAEIHVAGVPA